MALIRLALEKAAECAQQRPLGIWEALGDWQEISWRSQTVGRAKRPRGEGRMCKRFFRKSLRFARYQIRKGTASLRLLIRRKAPSGSER